MVLAVVVLDSIRSLLLLNRYILNDDLDFLSHESSLTHENVKTLSYGDFLLTLGLLKQKATWRF